MGQSFQEIKNRYICRLIHHWLLSSAWVLEKFVCDLKNHADVPHTCSLELAVLFLFGSMGRCPTSFRTFAWRVVPYLWQRLFCLFVCLLVFREKNRFSSRRKTASNCFCFQWQSCCLTHLTVLSSQDPWLAPLEWLPWLWRTVVWCHNMPLLNVFPPAVLFS